MSDYNPQAVVNKIENEQKTHYQKITDGTTVKDTLETKGWKKVIGPMLDKMVKDILGGKYFNRWSGGSLTKIRKDETLSYYIGYKQALIDLHNRIWNYVDQIEKSRKIIDKLDKEKERPFKMPMEDESYSPEKVGLHG